MKHLRIWIQLTKLAFSTYLSNRIDSGAYFIGKLIRFGFFWLMIVSIFRFTPTMAGYTKHEVLLFFLTFNLVDVLSQALFRGIYFFSKDIIKGTFDFVLSKPLNALFYTLFRMTDILDFLFLIPIAILIGVVVPQIPDITPLSLLLYPVMILISMTIILGIHIISAALTLRTLDSDNIIWLYRETIGIGRFPPDVLSRSVQVFFTYVIPIIVAVSFPVKAVLRQISPAEWMVAFGISTLFLLGSLIVWRMNVRYYSSASS